MKHDIIVVDDSQRLFTCQRCGANWRRDPGTSLCPGVRWYPWQSSPDYLRTFTQLRAKHLKPADRSKPDGCIFCKKEWVWLYDERQAIPRRQCSDRQLQALAVARQRQRDKWKCQYCGYEPTNPTEMRHYFAWAGLCRSCKEHVEHIAMIQGDCLEAVEWARTTLARDDWAIIDTETTSLTGYPVEIAIIAPDGSPLFHSLINPPCAVTPGARAVHGISDEELATAPTLPEVWADLQAALAGRSLLLAYGVDFDQVVMNRAASHYQLAELGQEWQCLKLWYAQYCGDWSNYWKSYRWQSLDGGHRALMDTRAALAVLHEMARGTALDNEEE